VGFNTMQPGRIKRGDLLYLATAIVVIIGLVVWAVR
jgi:hypothetical protein